MGLSPRVRGNQMWCLRLLRLGRSIPAGAGEPSSFPPAVPAREVYPRGCGGTRNANLVSISQSGLSPRVRGNHFLVVKPRTTPRSIPAGAGEPRCGTSGRGRQGVYPRGCGGTLPTTIYRLNRGGLSPRVRGNLADIPTTHPMGGSIPAGAGEPITTNQKILLGRVYPRGCGGTGNAGNRTGMA